MTISGDGLTIYRGVSSYTGSAGTAPTITSDGGGSTATITVSPPATDVTTVTATGTAPVTFMISGGVDASLFQIDVASGDLSFIDASVAGSYDVIVAATNLAGVDTQAVTVDASDAYHAGAVQFDGSAYLQIASLTAADSPLLSASGWLKITDVDDFYFFADFLPATIENNFKITSDGVFQTSLSPDGINYSSWQSNAFFPFDDVWHHFLVACDMNHDAGEKIVRAFFDGVEVPNIVNLHDAQGAFNLPFSGVAVGVPDTPANYEPLTGDGADWWTGPGQFIIDPAIFRDPLTGKPLNPNTFPDSALLNSGDAAAFATNLGTGGAFTLTGSLTNASTSPSD